MGSDQQRVRISFGGPLTPVVRALLWINGLTYLFLLLVERRELMLDGLSIPYGGIVSTLLGLVPRSVINDWAFWQPITYMFIHRKFWHLLINMMIVWWFGADIERQFGSQRFFRYYFFTGIGAAICSVLFNWNSAVPTIGASGAVFGILLASLIMFPNRVVYLYFVIPVKLKYLVMGLTVIEVFTLITVQGDGVDHVAHLGGMFFGLLWFGYTRSGFRLRDYLKQLNRRRMRRRLRIVRKGDDDESAGDTYDKHTIH